MLQCEYLFVNRERWGIVPRNNCRCDKRAVCPAEEKRTSGLFAMDRWNVSETDRLCTVLQWYILNPRPDGMS